MGFFTKIVNALEILNEINKNSNSHSKLDEREYIAMDFEDSHYSKLEKWDEKISEVFNTAYDKSYVDGCVVDPDKVIKNYEKESATFNKFKEYCESFGDAGIAYYEYIGQKYVLDAKKEYENYISNTYDEDKTEFEEYLAERKQEEEKNKEYLKYRKNITAKITKHIKEAGGTAFQADIIKIFVDDKDKSEARSIIKSKIEDGYFIKSKSGSKVVITIKDSL